MNVRVKAIRLSLFAADARSVLRDGTSMLFMVIPLLTAVLFRFGAPAAADLLHRGAGFDLTLHYGLITGMAMILAPLMLGTVAGFMIIDDRDDGILHALAVTPLSRGGYCAHKIGLTTAVCFLYALSYPLIIGLGPTAPVGAWIAAAFMASLEAPAAALFLGAMAGNKVEGLALSKVMNFVNVSPLIGYLVTSPWNYLAGIFPPFWVAHIWVRADRGVDSLWIVTLAGLAVHIFWLGALLRLFNRRVES